MNTYHIYNVNSPVTGQSGLCIYHITDMNGGTSPDVREIGSRAFGFHLRKEILEEHVTFVGLKTEAEMSMIVGYNLDHFASSRICIGCLGLFRRIGNFVYGTDAFIEKFGANAIICNSCERVCRACGHKAVEPSEEDDAIARQILNQIPEPMAERRPIRRDEDYDDDGYDGEAYFDEDDCQDEPRPPGVITFNPNRMCSICSGLFTGGARSCPECGDASDDIQMSFSIHETSYVISSLEALEAKIRDRSSSLRGTLCHHCSAITCVTQPIQNYSYRPEPKFFKGEYLSKKPIIEKYGEQTGTFYGIEYEVEVNVPAERLIKAMNCPRYLYYKRDSSLSRGFEICTQPMSFAFIKSKRKELKALVERSVEMGHFDGSNAGMHVHISREGIKNSSIRKVAKYLYNNYFFLHLLSERDETSLRRYSTICSLWYSYKELSKIFLISHGQNGTHDVLNFSHPYTYEMRLFSSPVKFNIFMANLELVDALFAYATNCKKIDTNGLIKFVGSCQEHYPHLNKVFAKNAARVSRAVERDDFMMDAANMAREDPSRMMKQILDSKTRKQVYSAIGLKYEGSTDIVDREYFWLSTAKMSRAHHLFVGPLTKYLSCTDPNYGNIADHDYFMSNIDSYIGFNEQTNLQRLKKLREEEFKP